MVGREVVDLKGAEESADEIVGEEAGTKDEGAKGRQAIQDDMSPCRGDGTNHERLFRDCLEENNVCRVHSAILDPNSKLHRWKRGRNRHSAQHTDILVLAYDRHDTPDEGERKHSVVNVVEGACGLLVDQKREKKNENGLQMGGKPRGVFVHVGEQSMAASSLAFAVGTRDPEKDTCRVGA
jgi:hypothetical protein